MKNRRKTCRSVWFCFLLTVLLITAVPVSGEESGGPEEEDTEETGSLLREYSEYQERFAAVENRDQLAENGFSVIEKQIFPLETACFGAVTFVPAIDRRYHRLALFLTDEDGAVVYRTDALETNQRNKGKLAQPVIGISAVSFQDLNADGRTDIVIISFCVNQTGAYAGTPYKTGDVLFQGERGFYRDYRISDKINRFGMNKSVESITAFVRDGGSTEFLYTAATKDELLKNGFVIAEEQCYPRRFEKLGRLEVVPGTYRMADFSTFMIYLIDDQGYIVWSLQPMGDYEDLYALKGITCRDIDGDGMKDILVLARYSYTDADGETVTQNDYSVYYQRTGGFYAGTEVKKAVFCEDDDTVAELVERARAYWGWKSEL